MFYNELDLLELRLNELYDTVDRFVLVEATQTHQGNDKELVYDKNKERFSEFSDKIRHIIVDIPEDIISAWERENYHRNSICEGLTDCDSMDTIIVSDVDEIPHPRYVERYSDSLGVKVFGLKLYYYYFNNFVHDRLFPGSVMVNYGTFETPQKLRDIAMQHVDLEMVYDIPFHHYPFAVQATVASMKASISLRQLVRVIPNSGWHFSYIHNVENIINKIESFAHTEHNREKYKNSDEIKEKMTSGEDIFERNYKMDFVELDNSFPEYLLKNKDRFSEYIIEYE